MSTEEQRAAWRDASKRYRQKDKPRWNAVMRRYRRNHNEQHTAYNRDYYERNREKVLAWNKAWRLRNPEHGQPSASLFGPDTETLEWWGEKMFGDKEALKSFT